MSRAVTQIADSSLLLWTVVSVVVSAVVAGPLAHRMERSWLGTFLALASLGEIVVITLAVRDGSVFSHGGALDGVPLSDRLGWWRTGWEASRVVAPDQPEWLLNVVLVVPAGLAWTALTRNAPLTVAWLAMVSFLVETIQALTGAGAPDTADLVANSIGAVIGALLGVAWIMANGRDTGLSPRGVLIGAVGLVTVVVGLFVTVQVQADRRLEQLERELHAEFDAANRSILGAGTGASAEGTSATADSTFDEFMRMVSVRPDSIVYSDDHRVADVRYPIEYFGVHRCAFVRFTPDGTTFRREGGSACTRFRGEPTGQVASSGRR